MGLARRRDWWHSTNKRCVGSPLQPRRSLPPPSRQHFSKIAGSCRRCAAAGRHNATNFLSIFAATVDALQCGKDGGGPLLPPHASDDGTPSQLLASRRLVRKCASKNVAVPVQTSSEGANDPRCFRENLLNPLSVTCRQTIIVEHGLLPGRHA